MIVMDKLAKCAFLRVVGGGEHIYIYTYTRICRYIYAHMYIYTYMCPYTCFYMCLRVYICMWKGFREQVIHLQC